MRKVWCQLRFHGAHFFLIRFIKDKNQKKAYDNPLAKKWMKRISVQKTGIMNKSLSSHNKWFSQHQALTLDNHTYTKAMGTYKVVVLNELNNFCHFCSFLWIGEILNTKSGVHCTNNTKIILLFFEFFIKNYIVVLAIFEIVWLKYICCL